MNALALSLRAVLAPVAGVPFALAALLPLTVVDGQHAVLGLVTAVLATFTLVLPVMAILEGEANQAAEAATRLPLTAGRYAALLALWVAADLAGALLAR
ncbi:MAG: hypothetical protein BGO51_16800 [Rhodospirillales bacterium 69-11]|nr:hypothetical protein [Rhodospirillales bacterium]OJW28974.1 MAG: hypothetical protein BGO51_16800 [Rhodospirillales bacterium 69-11]